MGTLTRIWSPLAIEDVQAVRTYVTPDSPHSADLLVERLVAAVERLEAQPFSGRVVPEVGDASLREVGLWRGLTRFLEDPRIPLDYNATERFTVSAVLIAQFFIRWASSSTTISGVESRTTSRLRMSCSWLPKRYPRRHAIASSGA